MAQDQATPDTRARDTGSATDRKNTLTQTQAVTGAAGGGAITLIYVMTCWTKHTMIVPTIEQAIGVLIVAGPFLHLLGRIVMYWTGRLLPKDANS
jgi:hypothetical protein